MYTRIALAFALAGSLAAVSVPAAASVSDLPFMPDGSYQYTLKEGANTIGTSSVSVKRSGSVVMLHETQMITDTPLGSVQITADEQILADSLAPLLFSGQTVSSGKTDVVKLVLSGTNGAFTHNGERITVPVRMLAGTQAMAVHDQALVSGFIVLPALAHATKANAFTIAVPTAAQTFIMRTDPALPSRPAGVAAGDVGFAIASPVAFSIWYDPRTGIVDRVEVPSQSLVIDLAKHS